VRRAGELALSKSVAADVEETYFDDDGKMQFESLKTFVARAITEKETLQVVHGAAGVHVPAAPMEQ
jgi:hypothetical protein